MMQIKMTYQNKGLPVSSACNIFNFTPNFYSEFRGTKCKLNWEIETFHVATVCKKVNVAKWKYCMLCSFSLHGHTSHIN